MLDQSCNIISINVCNVIYFSSLDEELYYKSIEKISFIKEIKGEGIWDYFILDIFKINYAELELLIIILSRYNVNIKNIINLIKIVNFNKSEYKWILKTINNLSKSINNDISFCEVIITNN